MMTDVQEGSKVFKILSAGFYRDILKPFSLVSKPSKKYFLKYDFK